MPCYLLVDNGSKQPAATLRLRELAASLSDYSGRDVYPVSLQHADAIDPADLGGSVANTFTDFVREKLEQGERTFLIIPLFFGMSRALTSFIPQQVEILKTEFSDFSVKVADVVYPLPEGDERLVEIILDHIFVAQESLHTDAKVVLVDHGSPIQKITEVRNRIAQTVMNMTDDIGSLAEAVMERREGKEYDFNGELLESWLNRQGKTGVEFVIIAMLFFLPGRHAGSCGDIETICENVVKQFPQLQYRITPLISEHPRLLEVLSDRLQSIETE